MASSTSPFIITDITRLNESLKFQDFEFPVDATQPMGSLTFISDVRTLLNEFEGRLERCSGESEENRAGTTNDDKLKMASSARDTRNDLFDYICDMVHHHNGMAHNINNLNENYSTAPPKITMVGGHPCITSEITKITSALTACSWLSHAARLRMMWGDE
jgi:hypothetical protein